MKRSRFIYILILLLALSFAMGLRDRLSTVTLVAALIIPVISLVLFLLSVRSVYIRIIPASIYAQKLEQANAQLEVYNMGIYPFIHMRLTGDLPNVDENSITRQRILLELNPKATAFMALPICLRYRGEYAINVSYIDLYDVLGLFHIKVKVNTDARIIVLPRRFGIGSLGSAAMSEDNDSKAKNNMGIDKVDLSHIREYADGDVLKSVHWKLSAKQGELMVKVLEDNSNSSAAIICDLNAYHNDFDKDNLAVDGVIESCIAVAYRLIFDSYGSVVHWYSCEHKQILRQETKNEYSFERLFSQLSKAKIITNPFPFEQLLDQVKRELSETNGVYIITPSLTAERITSLVSFSRTFSSEINLLYIDIDKERDTMLDAALEGTGIKLWKLDPNDLKASLELALSENVAKS